MFEDNFFNQDNKSFNDEILTSKKRGKFSFGETTLSNIQKNIIDIQNEMIFNFALTKLNFLPYAISRDKKGHVLLIQYYSDDRKYPEFNCYMLGINNENKTLTLYLAGKNNFRILNTQGIYSHENSFASPNTLKVNSLSTHPAFDNLGIGRVLLQTSENYAIENKLTKMNLSSLKCYVPIQSKYSNKYTVETYFDKNYYFYSSQGFKQYKTEYPLCDNVNGESSIRPLRKNQLKKITIDYGLNKPLFSVNKRDKMFSIETEPVNLRNFCLNEYTYDSLFPLFFNNITSENFSPIVLEPTDFSTKILQTLIEQAKTKPPFKPSKNYIKSHLSQPYTSTSNSTYKDLEYQRLYIDKIIEKTSSLQLPKEKDTTQLKLINLDDEEEPNQ